MKTIQATNQAELDQALNTVGVEDVVLDSLGDQRLLRARHKWWKPAAAPLFDGSLIVKGTTRVRIEQSSMHVFAYERSYVEALSGNIRAYDCSKIVAGFGNKDAAVAAHDTANVIIRRGEVTAFDTAYVNASGRALVTAFDSSIIRAHGRATVYAQDEVNVCAGAYAVVYAVDAVQVWCYDSAQAVLDGGAVCDLTQTAKAIALNTQNVYCGPDAKVLGDLSNIHDFDEARAQELIEMWEGDPSGLLGKPGDPDRRRGW